MEQLINSMLANVQTPQQAPTVKKGDSAQKDDFQKLMEQKADAPEAPKPERADAAQDSQETKEPVQTVQKPQEAKKPVETVKKSGKELEDQMLLALIATRMRNPLVAEIAEKTPQVLTDPSWEEGLVPVGYDDNEELGLRVVHWLQAGEVEQGPDAGDGAAVEWMESWTNTEYQTEAPIEIPAAETQAEAPVVEIKVETGREDPEAENAGDDGEDDEAFQGAEAEAPVFKDVKAVPVKVGEAPKTEQTQQPVEKQIVPKLTEALNNGETRVELQLTPENLGKVKVEMTWKEDGSLVVQIHAENRDTQNLLNKNASGLEALLSRETQQEVRVEVPRQEESQRQDLYEQQQQHHHQQQQERQEQRRSHPGDSENFLQQLRLGLIPMEGE